MNDGLVTYDVPTGEVYGLSREAVQPKKRVRGVDGVSTTVKLTAVPVTFRTGVLRVDLASIWQEFAAFRGRSGYRGVAERAEASGGTNLDALVENELCGPRLVMRGVLRKRHCY